MQNISDEEGVRMYAFRSNVATPLPVAYLYPYAVKYSMSLNYSRAQRGYRMRVAYAWCVALYP